MSVVELADAQAHLSELVDRVANGEAIDIARQGTVVARLTALSAPRRPIDLAALQALTAALPAQGKGAGDLVRSMRDDDRA